MISRVGDPKTVRLQKFRSFLRSCHVYLVEKGIRLKKRAKLCGSDFRGLPILESRSSFVVAYQPLEPKHGVIPNGRDGSQDAYWEVDRNSSQRGLVVIRGVFHFEASRDTTRR